MRRMRALSAALTLLCGITVQTVQAAPLRVAQLKAHSCCAGRCHRTTSLGRAMQCCRVPQDASAPLTAAPAPDAPQATPFVVSAAPVVPAAPVAVALLDASPGWSRAGPIYLQTRSLRL